MPLAPIAILRTFKYVMYFNGVNASAAVPYSPSYAVLGSGTWIVWVYIPQLKSSGGGDIFRDGDYPYRRAEIEMDYPNSRFIAGFDPHWIYTPVGSLTNYVGRWVMLTYRRITEQGLHSLIVNNFETSWSGSFPPNTQAPSSTIGLTIGYFNPLMYLYSLMIYSRALTDSEIASIYNNPDSSITSGLVLWLKADPAYIQGNTWLDLSGNGNNATLYNAQLVQLINPPIQLLPPIAILPPIA